MSQRIIDVCIRKGNKKQDGTYWPDNYYISISPDVKEGDYVGPNYGNSYQIHPDIIPMILQAYNLKSFQELRGMELAGDFFKSVFLTSYFKSQVIGNIILKRK